MSEVFGVVDLFAGPGGLGEGFASFQRGESKPFKIAISIEKEASAHRTLLLRSFLRAYQDKYGCLPEEYLRFHSNEIGEPDWNSIDSEAWKTALAEAQALELGSEQSRNFVNDAIERVQREYCETVLIGGPPCQAYSLAGRAKARSQENYKPEEDERHYLFKEYIGVLDRLRPAAFVMENVKGILSSSVDSRLIYQMLMDDLSSLGKGDENLYRLLAVKVEHGNARLSEPMKPSDFIVRSEQFGVPQRRHRFIIIGIRSDISMDHNAVVTLPASLKTVDNAIGNLSMLRSGLSRGRDSKMQWQKCVFEAADHLSDIFREAKKFELQHAFLAVRDAYPNTTILERSASSLPEEYAKSNDFLKNWLEKPGLRAIAQHETRGHMETDLTRYLFASVFAKLQEFSPKASDFPMEISPNHKNWTTGIFNDRFRVQLANEPSSTITSHISKDGHYFIHPDPMQCRSLTVREAARLQTFSDDYLFLGNRTQQYVQVGNAVPPLLAKQIAELIFVSIAAPKSKIKRD